MRNFRITLGNFIKNSLVLTLLSTNLLYAVEMEGSVSTRFRFDSDRARREQYSAKFRFKHDFGEESCLSVNAHLQTGVRYGSNNVDYDQGLELNLRKVYLDVKCLIDKSIQIGAIPVESLNGLDLDKNSWIDGMKVAVDMKGIIDRFTLTYGSVNQDASPDVIERFKEDRIQFVRATIEKELTDKLKASLALTDFKDDVIFQAVLEVSTKDIFPFADEIQLYTTRGKKKSYHNAIEFKKQLGDYALKYGVYDIDEELYDVSSFVREEDAVFISISRTFLERIKITIRARKGRTEERLDVQAEYIF